MSKKQALGRGLDALVPKELGENILEEDKGRVQKLLISDIKPNPEQPRRQHLESDLHELTQSVKRHGVLQPIIVVKQGNRYQIVAGERRWRAAKTAGHKNIPAIVRSLEELEQVELALIENIQRVDLSPLEQALAVFKLQQQFNLGLEEIAKKLGKAPSSVSNLARLLQLPEAAREALKKGQISEGHARAILAIKQLPDKQGELLSGILNNKWTVRQAEQFAVAAKAGSSLAEARARTSADSELTRKISQKMAASVKIKHTAKGGHLIIQFKDTADLGRIAEQLLD